MPKLEKTTLSCAQQFRNPPGKGSAAVAPRHVISMGMRQKYATLMKKYRKAFKLWIYKFGNKDCLYHVRVPSQDFEHNKIAYDTLIYIPYGDDKTNALKLDQKPAFFWTNSPSFAYTYCYVYAEKGVMLRDFDEKLPDACFSQPPLIRNPDMSLGYDYGLWQALAYIYSLGAFGQRVFDHIAIPANDFNQSILRRRINDLGTLLSIHKLAKYEQVKKHRVKMSPTEEVLAKTRRENYKRNEQKFGKVIKPKKAIGAIKAKKAVKQLLNPKKFK